MPIVRLQCGIVQGFLRVLATGQNMGPEEQANTIDRHSIAVSTILKGGNFVRRILGDGRHLRRRGHLQPTGADGQMKLTRTMQD